MSEQTAADSPAKAEENALEASARALSEFVIRAALLPITLLFMKPSVILKSTQTGNYRPLPSPFLLSLVTGVMISGLTSNLGKLDEGDDRTAAYAGFLEAVTQFYAGTDGVRAILFALPFIAALWVAAGLTSILMGRGLRLVNPLFSAFALCAAAIIAVAAIVFGVALTWSSDLSAIGPYVVYAVAAIALIYASKCVRLILALREGSPASWIGASAASLFALCAIGLLGAAGGAISGGVFLVAQDQGRMEREIEDLAAQMSPEQKAATFLTQCTIQEEENNLIGAAPLCDEALRLRPDWPEALMARGRVHLRRGEVVAALADYGAAAKAGPSNVDALNGRGLVQLRRKEFAAAFSDFDAALKLSAEDSPQRAAALYGRGLALLRLGKKTDGDADIAAAVALDQHIESAFARDVDLGLD